MPKNGIEATACIKLAFLRRSSSDSRCRQVKKHGGRFSMPAAPSRTTKEAAVDTSSTVRYGRFSTHSLPMAAVKALPRSAESDPSA